MSRPSEADAQETKPSQSRLRPARPPKRSRKDQSCISSRAHRHKLKEAKIPDRDEIAAAILNHFVHYMARGSESAWREAKNALNRLPEKYDQDAALDRLKAMVEREKARRQPKREAAQYVSTDTPA